MNTSSLSLMPGSAPSAPQPDGGPSQGFTQLQLPAGAHVHIHLGTLPVPGAAPVIAAQPVAGQRLSRVSLAVAGLALLGGGYLAGSRGTAARAGGDSPGTLVSSPLPLAPDLPPAPGEIPPALRAQLARPPVVTPPPGAAAAPGGTGAPVRNPFGLGN